MTRDGRVDIFPHERPDGARGARKSGLFRDFRIRTHRPTRDSADYLKDVISEIFSAFRLHHVAFSV